MATTTVPQVGPAIHTRSLARSIAKPVGIVL